MRAHGYSVVCGDASPRGRIFETGDEKLLKLASVPLQYDHVPEAGRRITESAHLVAIFKA